MSQTNAIILRIKADRAKDFERLFKKHQYPNWVKHHKRGGMLAASLTRVEYGVEEETRSRAITTTTRHSKRGTRWPSRSSPRVPRYGRKRRSWRSVSSDRPP